MNENDINFQPQYLDDSRKHMISAELVSMLYNHFGLIENQKIIDVGCGTGYFTRLISSHLNNHCKIIGIDINKKLIDEAKKLNEAFSDIITYLQGDALSLSSYLDNDFEVTMCHFLLSRVTISKAEKIIDEMIKITCEGGKIAIIEPCLGAMVSLFYENDNLSDRLTMARRIKSRVQRQLKGIDENIGMRIPTLLSKRGIKNIKTEIVALRWWTPLPFDVKNMDDELRQWYQRRLISLYNPEEKSIIENYGKYEDAALGLRYSSHQVPDNIEQLISLYAKNGFTRQDLIELGDERIKQINNILSGDVMLDMVADFELIPTFAVVGIK